MSDRMLRVLLMIDDASVGGGQKHVLWLAEHLDHANFEVAVACGGAGYLVDELARAKVRHYPLRLSNMPNPAAFIRCRRVMRDFKPDIVHTHGGTAGVTGRIVAGSMRGVRVVHTYHGFHYIHDPRRLRSNLFRNLEAALLRLTDRTICVAQQDVETGKRQGIVDPGKTVVIRNGIDTSAFEGDRRRDFPSDPVIGTVGRLHLQKGHRFLLTAAAGLLKTHPAARFVIIGEGELRGELEREAGRQGIAKAVTFAGARTDVPAQLRAMDIFVLPSLWEGLPLILLEAMAAGLPIVSTGADGVREILTDGKDALLVPPGNPTALQRGIEKLLDDPALRARLADEARKTVRDNFSAGRMVKETEDVYRSLFR